MNLDAGTYRARAVEAELGLAGNGSEQVAVLFEIVEDGQHFGERITWYGYFTQGTFARTIESLRHAGWQGDDLADLSTVGSKECSIVLEWESYEGRDSLRVKWVNAGGGGMALKRRMDDAGKRAFAAKMRGQVVAASGGRASTTSRPAPPRPPAHAGEPRPQGSGGAGPSRAAGEPPPSFGSKGGDDDIPFLVNEAERPE